MNIGYVGLGAMGGALARHLAGGSHRLTVWDINDAATAPFEALGARIAPTAVDLACDCDIVLLCLPRSSDVRELMFGPRGLAAELRAGTLVVDQTSGVPGETAEIAAELARRDVEMIDAPVSGGVVGAAAGTITIMVSGSEANQRRAMPVLSAISPNVFRCGDRVGDGQATKLVNNLLSAGCRVAALEVTALGRKMGLPLKPIVNALNQGAASNRTTKLTLQGLVDDKPAVSRFAMALMLKDINQSVQLGHACGIPTTMANMVRGLLQIGVSTMGHDVQFDRILQLVESLAETRIAESQAMPASTDASLGPVDPKLLHVIQNALLACNQLLVYEAASIGVKYGLALGDVSTLVIKSTGWSAAAARTLPNLSRGGSAAGIDFRTMVEDLKQASRLAAEFGSPFLLANTACSLYEAGLQRFGVEADIDAMAHLFEAMGGFEFRGA